MAARPSKSISAPRRRRRRRPICKALAGGATARISTLPPAPTRLAAPGPWAELLTTVTFLSPRRGMTEARNSALLARGSTRMNRFFGYTTAAGIPGKPAPLPTSITGSFIEISFRGARLSRMCSPTIAARFFAPVRLVLWLASRSKDPNSRSFAAVDAALSILSSASPRRSWSSEALPTSAGDEVGLAFPAA